MKPEFKELLGKKVDRLFLAVWPPWGEKMEINIDVSFGFVFKNNPQQLIIISVDKDELWSPKLLKQPLPQKAFSGEEFFSRMKMWMNAAENNSIIDKEYYDVTNCKQFERIVDEYIIEIEFICIEGNPEPFGVKVHFLNDYIISMPNADGNTVETKYFNRNNAIEGFKHLGNVIWTKA